MSEEKVVFEVKNGFEDQIQRLILETAPIFPASFSRPLLFYQLDLEGFEGLRDRPVVMWLSRICCRRVDTFVLNHLANHPYYINGLFPTNLRSVAS
jgi:hypothetical protein